MIAARLSCVPMDTFFSSHALAEKGALNSLPSLTSLCVLSRLPAPWGAHFNQTQAFLHHGVSPNKEKVLSSNASFPVLGLTSSWENQEEDVYSFETELTPSVVENLRGWLGGSECTHTDTHTSMHTHLSTEIGNDFYLMADDRVTTRTQVSRLLGQF